MTSGLSTLDIQVITDRSSASSILTASSKRRGWDDRAKCADFPRSQDNCGLCERHVQAQPMTNRTFA
jgi:hypothetical protein